MAIFPKERPLTPHDIMDLAENGVFSSFEEALTNLGTNLIRRDFDFTECDRYVGHPGVIIARPRSGQGDHWAMEEDSGQWFQNPDWDPNTNSLDTSKCPAPPQAAQQQSLQGLPPPIVAGSGAPVGHARMTGGPQSAIPDVGNLGKGDPKEMAEKYGSKIDAIFGFD